MNEEYYIGQIFEEMYPSEAASWCNANKAQITEIDPIDKEVEETYIEMVEVEKEIVVPAEYDENGEMISEEHTEIQVVEEPQEKTRAVVVTVRCFEIQTIPEPTPPTHEEVRQMRAAAYQQEVDPITSHIQRLRDKEQTEEIIAEINDLMTERDAKVEEIKALYPYPLTPSAQ